MDISRPSISRRLHNACAASVHSAAFPFALTSPPIPGGRLRYFVCRRWPSYVVLFPQLADPARPTRSPALLWIASSRYSPPTFAPPLSALITIISIENFRAWSSDRGKVYLANLGWFNLLGLFFTRCFCIIFLFEKVILMMIKEGWIMEGVVTRSKDFGTVLIMDLLENKSYVRFLCFFF